MRKKQDPNQSARFREAAKKAEVGDGKAFEKAFKKIVTEKKPKKTQIRSRFPVSGAYGHTVQAITKRTAFTSRHPATGSTLGGYVK